MEPLEESTEENGAVQTRKVQAFDEGYDSVEQRIVRVPDNHQFRHCQVRFGDAVERDGKESR